MEDCLVITVDISKDDKPTLLVTRRDGDLRFTIVNQIFGDEAVEIYHKLIGNTMMVRTHDKKVRSGSDN